MTYIDYGYDTDTFNEDIYLTPAKSFYEPGDSIEYSIAWSSIESAPGVFVDPWPLVEEGGHHRSLLQKKINLNINVGLRDRVCIPYDLQGLAPDHPLFIERFKEMMTFALGQVDEGLLIDTVTLTNCSDINDAGIGVSEKVFLQEVRTYMNQMDPMIHFMVPVMEIIPKYKRVDSSVA